MTEEHVLDVAERRITVSSPDKVFFSERGETKLDLVRYYLAVAEPLMRATRRAADAHAALPPRRRGQLLLPEARPGVCARLAPDDDRHDAERHDLPRARPRRHGARRCGPSTWPASASTSGRTSPTTPSIADELRLDLDPQPGVEFDEVRAAAAELRRLLDELGIVGYPKTTGNRGLHVYVRLEPRWDSYQVRSAAVAAARELERRRPDLITAAWWKEERGARVFVDYNQNAPHKTVFGAWSVRARPGAQVSTPLALGRDRRRCTPTT